MLKGIPEILSPELLKVLCEMGHSDRLVIADGNFPVESMGKKCHYNPLRRTRRTGNSGSYPESFPTGYLCGASCKSYGSYAGRYCRNSDLGYIQRNHP